jgi:hypothetical protein
MVSATRRCSAAGGIACHLWWLDLTEHAVARDCFVGSRPMYRARKTHQKSYFERTARFSRTADLESKTRYSSESGLMDVLRCQPVHLHCKLFDNDLRRER